MLLYISMKLTIIGSGTSVPHPKRTSSSYWIETAKGSLMMDFSASAVHRIAQEKLDWANLDAIWISHFHLDHIGGLVPFLFGTKHSSAVQTRTKPLRIFGPGGLKKILNIYTDAKQFKPREHPHPIEIIEVEPLQKFEILDDLEAISFDTPHTSESRAIHLKDAIGKTLVFTSDTGFTKALGTFASNADLFLMECSFVKNKRIETHLELAEAMYLARYSKAKRIVLTHLYPEWDMVDFDEEIEKFTPNCEVIEAKDGLRIEI